MLLNSNAGRLWNQPRYLSGFLFGFLICLPMFKIITWSLRTPKRRGRVKKWISINKPDIVVFQESLLNSCNESIVRQIWGPGCMDWRSLDAI